MYVTPDLAQCYSLMLPRWEGIMMSSLIHCSMGRQAEEDPNLPPGSGLNGFAVAFGQTPKLYAPTALVPTVPLYACPPGAIICPAAVVQCQTQRESLCPVRPPSP